MTIRQLQQKIVKACYEANSKEFSFEEAANPTIPGCQVIFEFGLADGDEFSYIDGEELEKTSNLLETTQLDTMDFFCAVRYYKGGDAKRNALKFDYYFIRTLYGKAILEVQVYHKKGLRYISPEDLVLFIAKRVNEGAKKQILKKQSSGD